MDRITYLLVRLVWLLISLVPLRVVIGFARLAGLLGWWLAPSYRRLVRRNLAIAFGSELTPVQRTRMGRDHFCSLAANIAAGACLSRVPAAGLRGMITVEGLEHLHRARGKGKGVIGLLAHLGNWELLARLSPGVFEMPCGSVYQSLTNAHVDAWVRRARAQEGLELFDRKKGFHGAIQLLRRGGILGVLADQHAGDAGVWCPMFGRLASTSPLAATLAMRTGAAVLGIALYTEPKGRWRLVIRPETVPEGRDSTAFTALLNKELEAMIRVAPSEWLWSHNRWKTPKPHFLGIGGKRGVLKMNGVKPFRLLVRSVNWLGDAVMTVPAVRAMRQSRPDLEITVACPAKLAEFWESVEGVDRVLSLPKAGGIRVAASMMREHCFDAALVFPNSLRAGIEVWLAGIPRRVGYPGHSRAFLLNQVIKRPKPPSVPQEMRHQVHDYLWLASSIGAPHLEESEWRVQSRAHPVSGSGRALRIAVCPGAEFGGAKRWLPERFAETMQIVSRTQFVEWIVVGVAKDAPVAEVIVSSCAGLNVENLTGRTGLKDLIVILKSCDALLTNDTGTMHLAALFGVPLVAVFGSTEPRLTGPIGENSIVVQHRVPCGPCFQRECHLDFACMRGVDSAAVAKQMFCLLEQNPLTKKGSLPNPG